MQTLDGKALADAQTRLQADNSDVVFIEDWSKVLQRNAVVSGKEAGAGQWEWRTGLPAHLRRVSSNGQLDAAIAHTYQITIP